MKKYLLSATALTFLISTSALADVTQSYQECRQAEGRLDWFLVTYTVYPQPAPTGHRIPTAVEDMKQACTAADYQQSRQAGAMWGESWPALQAQPNEVTPSVRQSPANTPAPPVTDPPAATASQVAAPVIKPRQSNTVMANKDSGGGRDQEIAAKAPQQAAPAIKNRQVDRSPTAGEIGDPSVGSGNRTPRNGPDVFTPTPENTSLGGPDPGSLEGRGGPVDRSLNSPPRPKHSDVKAAPAMRHVGPPPKKSDPGHNGGQGRTKEPSGSFQKPANEQPVQRSMHSNGTGKSRQHFCAKTSPPMNSSQLGNGSHFGTSSHFAGSNRFASDGSSNFGGNGRLVVRRLGPRFGGGMGYMHRPLRPRFGGGMGYMHGPGVRPTFR